MTKAGKWFKNLNMKNRITKIWKTFIDIGVICNIRHIKGKKEISIQAPPGSTQIFKFIQQILNQTTKGVDNEQKASV